MSVEKTYRLLLVDDEAPLRMLFSMALDDERFVTEEARDGVEANELLERDRYDLVVMDLDMPGRTGLEALKRMREVGDQTRVIFLSAYIPDFAVIQGIQMGVTDFLSKPVTLEAFRNAVASALFPERKTVLQRALGAVRVGKINRGLEILSGGGGEMEGERQVWRRALECARSRLSLQGASRQHEFRDLVA